MVGSNALLRGVGGQDPIAAQTRVARIANETANSLAERYL